MIFIVTGEGPSDIGTEEKPGPMLAIIDKLLEAACGFQLSDPYDFLHKRGLEERASQLRREPEKRVSLGRHGRQEIFYYRQARALVMIAKEKSVAHNCPVGAIFFRDGDGTNSSSPREWQEKRDSMKRAFHDMNFLYGVAMVPRPKSEAWLMCPLQANPHTNCGRFEDLPGNDISPHNAKALLESELNRHQIVYDDIADRITSGVIDVCHNGMDAMESYRLFREDLIQVAQAMLRD